MFQGALFQSAGRSSSLRVGPAGWNYKDWEGIVYPGTKSFDALAFLSEYCDTIEINSSFYAPPRAKDTASWARRVKHNPRFRFTAKAWNKLSHENRAGEELTLRADCDEVRRSMAPLVEAGVMGALLVQFPWRFRNVPENADYLDVIFRMLSDFPLVLEVRHGSWNEESFYDLLREKSVAFCNVDQPVIGDSLRPDARATARLGYSGCTGAIMRTGSAKMPGAMRGMTTCTRSWRSGSFRRRSRRYSRARRKRTRLPIITFEGRHW